MDPLTCALAALLLAGGSVPGHQLPVAVQDDALLLNRSPAQVQQYTGQIAEEGAAYVRLTASWSGRAGRCQRPRTATTASGTCRARPSSGCSPARWRAGTPARSPTRYPPLSPYQGNATYRMTVCQPGGTWAPSAEVPVSRQSSVRPTGP